MLLELLKPEDETKCVCTKTVFYVATTPHFLNVSLAVVIFNPILQGKRVSKTAITVGCIKLT